MPPERGRPRSLKVARRVSLRFVSRFRDFQLTPLLCRFCARFLIAPFQVSDVKQIMDRNSRRSKGVGYVEFDDAMSVPMAIALSGHLFLGQPIMVKPSEAEKNLVQSNTSAGGSGLLCHMVQRIGSFMWAIYILT